MSARPNTDPGLCVLTVRGPDAAALDWRARELAASYFQVGIEAVVVTSRTNAVAVYPVYRPHLSMRVDPVAWEATYALGLHPPGERR